MRRMRAQRRTSRRQTPARTEPPNPPAAGAGAPPSATRPPRTPRAFLHDSRRRPRTRAATPHDRHVRLYDLAPVGYLTLTGDGTIAQLNPACADMLGLPRARVSGRPLRRFAEPDAQARVDRLVAAALASDRSHRDELALRRPDGSVAHVEIVCRRAMRGHAPPVILAALNDVSRHKAIEQQLRIAATAFEAREGMVVLDRAQAILRVNHAFVSITGYSDREAAGHTLRLLDAGRHDEAFHQAIWDTVRAQGFWQGELWSRRKNGEVFPEWRTITAIREGEGDGRITHYVGTLTDNTARNREAAQIRHLAFHDALTELPNRQYLLNRLQQALAASTRSGHEGALLFIDLDHFKALNDTLGHDMGDLLLQQVARRLVTCVREGDTVARLGGDEFVVMLENLSPDLTEAAAQIEAVGEKILGALNQPYDLDGHPYRSTPSIGATLFNDHRDNVGELLKAADLAMYHAKAAGRNVLRFFDQRMQAAVDARSRMEAELRRSLERHAFVLHYQPQVDRLGRPCGAEAFLRWHHLGRELLTPAGFLALAEDSGLLVPIGQWALETACRQLKTWSRHPATARLTLSLNVSASEFRHPDFVRNALAQHARHAVAPRALCLELCESVLREDAVQAIEKMSALRRAGILLALDRFGQGSASLADLRHAPLDRVKLGEPFLRDLPHNPRDRAIAQGIVLLGQGLGLEVVAAGIETEAQREAAHRLGCHLFQGFLFGQPGPADTLRPPRDTAPANPGIDQPAF